MQKIRSSWWTGTPRAPYLLLHFYFALCLIPFLAAPRASANDVAKPNETLGDGTSEKLGDTQEILAGHSFHGEAFNEGPRQKAYLMGGTGEVTFPVSTEIELAQKFFDQGVGQLHGFWYFEAERSFRQVALLDPDCAMAYWGMAMANIENEKRALGFIKEAVERKKTASKRDQLWIDGLADYLKSKKKDEKVAKQDYIRSLEKIIHDFPDDIEAKAFLAVRLWQFKKDLPITSHQAVDAILDQVFAARPMHPAHHYRIHLWDNEKPERAMTSAALGGQSGPSIAHLWHMPGHIYSRVKRYPDAVWQQEASSRADHNHMMRDGVLPDQIHNYAHNQEWMTRNLINIGRSGDALAIATNLVEHPRHPKYNTVEKRGSSAAHGRARLFQVLQRFEMWDKLIELSETMYLEPTDVTSEQDKRIRALGVAHFEKGDSSLLLAQLVELQARLAHTQRERKVAQDKAEKEAKEAKKAAAEIDKAKADAVKPIDRRIKSLNESIAELNAYAGLMVGSNESAKTLLDQVTGIEKDRLARLYMRAGDHKKAERLASEAVESAKNEVIPLANQVDVLFRIGKKKEASEAFTKLRKISGHIDDLSLAPFERLSDVAAAIELPDDWRITPEPNQDVGERPALATIGPLRYTPSPAINWSLPNENGDSLAFEQFEGKPVVVIFYLGFGCLHCAEQLTAFAPKTKEFADAGISLVAVSTDTIKELKSSIDNFQVEGEFPFPLVSDSELGTFKAYRAFDDFENQPLHGTFLIDRDGFVRWQDISYEPFNDPDFLLKEAKRLLRLPVRPKN
ncbi:peroxiredoxin family protein [Roseiconus lacunae]|uniref:peroxiredoxin family protein n=1 Tax=Roseiconus lacunae TaxID=2605694 RepID=UPI0011F28B5D|nr:peroxiredoxin family protein [Roseiconus lacunae]